MVDPITAADRDAPDATPSGAGSKAAKAPAETNDDSLIPWMLSLPATRRLEVGQGLVDSVTVLRNAGREVARRQARQEEVHALATMEGMDLADATVMARAWRQ